MKEIKRREIRIEGDLTVDNTRVYDKEGNHLAVSKLVIEIDVKMGTRIDVTEVFLGPEQNNHKIIGSYFNAETKQLISLGTDEVTDTESTGKPE